MTVTTDQPARRLKWVTWSIAVLIVAVLIYSLRSRIALVARFQLAASSATAVDDSTHGLVHRDDLLALSQFPPQQIAGFLDSSRPKWRSIACQVLRAQAANNSDADWHGITLLLAEAALADSDQFLSSVAQDTLELLPSIPPDDGRRILALVERQPGSRTSAPVIAALAKNCNPILDDIRASLLRMALSEQATQRDMALPKVMELFPDDERIPELWMAAARGKSVPSTQLGNAFRGAAIARPSLIDEFLEGDTQQQLFVLRALGGSGVPLKSASSPSGAQPPDSRATLWAGLEPTAKQRALELAKELLSSADRDRKMLAIEFLRQHFDGGHILVQSLAAADLDIKLEILKSLRGMSWAAYYANDGVFQFTKEEGDSLVRLLNDSDRQIRNAAAEVVNPGIPPESRPLGAFVPETGPLDPANADIFRRLLDEPTGELDYLALNYFFRVIPFDESDIPRVIRAIRRDRESMEARAKLRGEPPPGPDIVGTAQAHGAFSTLRERFPEHPKVIALARDMLLTKASSWVNDVLSIDKIRRDNDALTVAATSQQHCEIACSRYRELRTMERTMQTNVVHPYPTQSSPEFRLLGNLIVAMALKPGNHIDGSTLKDAITDLLPSTWDPDRWPQDLPSREEFRSLLEPAVMVECERVAVADCLAAIVAKRGGVSIEEVTSEVQRLKSAQAFADEAAKAAAGAVASDDREVRCRGFFLFAAARIDSDEIKRAVVAGLDDQNARVQAAAADAIGAAGIKDTSVIAKLVALAESRQPGFVRAAGILNLALLAPHHADTQRLLTALSEDADFTVRTEARRAAKAIEAR